MTEYRFTKSNCSLPQQVLWGKSIQQKILVKAVLMLFHRLCSFSHSAAYLARNLLYSPYAKSRTSAYQGVINVRFSENIVYVLNEWSPAGLLKLEKKSLLSANLFFLPLKDRVIAYIANTLYFYKNQYIWFEASWFCFRFFSIFSLKLLLISS